MNKGKKENYPPKWADRFLEFYCNPELLEQIQGDIHELFNYRLEEQSVASARRAFVLDVLRFFRWRNIKKNTPSYYHHNSIAMFKNYIKIGWRNLIKQKGTTSINVLGLACAIACCLVAYLVIESVWLTGMYHKNKDDIYLFTHTAEENNEIITYGVVSSPIAELAEQELSSVKQWTRVNLNNYVIIHKNESFTERTLFVDPAFMDMFTYKMESGYGGALNEPQSVILTHSAAKKFFGDTHPIGQELGIVIGGEKKQFIVGGVMENLPSTAMLNFQIIVNNQALYAATKKAPTQDQWKNNYSWVFIQLEKDSSPLALQAGLENILNMQNQILPEDAYLDLQLEPYNSLVKHANTIESGPANHGSMGPQILLAIIALFMLTLAVFNYINISILMASKRLKEIGIRKVIGGRKRQLVFQFLCENLIICLIALLVGMIIAATLFLPWFNNMASENLQLDLFNNGYLWLFLGSLLVFVTLISGIYPAFYISSFKPVAIFTGKLRISNKNKFTGALLTFQFALSIITIVAGIAFLQTNKANETRDWGYNKESKLVVNVPSQADYLALRDDFKKEEDILNFEGSQDMIGHGLDKKSVSYQGKNYKVDVLRGSPNYPKLMDLRLKEGRFLNAELLTDSKTNILVNQTFMDQLGIQFPSKELISIDSSKYQIVGVVEDFHSHFFTFSIDPMVILGMPDSNYNYLTLKLTAGKEQKMAERVRSIWHKNVETGHYEGVLQASVFDPYYDDLNGVSNMLIFTSILAIMLSAMGLFGLVALNIQARMKDMSIRKIMGASLFQLSQKILTRYLILWAIASIAGSIMAKMMVSLMLNSLFAFHSGVSAIPICLAFTILFVVITLTISIQLNKVKHNNPVDVLKME